MEKTPFGKKPGIVFEERFNRIKRIPSKEDKKSALIHFSNLCDRDKYYKSAMGNFNKNLGMEIQLLGPKDPFIYEKIFLDFSKYIGFQKTQYKDSIKKLNELGADISGVSEELNYLEIQN